MINANTIYFIIFIITAIVFGITIFSAPLILVKQLKGVTTMLLCISFGLTFLLMLNMINLDIGHKQEPVLTVVKNEQTTVQIMTTYYENNELFAITERNQEILIPDNTVISDSMLPVRELFIRREWTFILPFYIEETEYEYVNESTPPKKGFKKHE